MAGLAIFVIVTNRYTNPGDDYLLWYNGMGDSFSYLAIAIAAPHLPSNPLPFHHAQRLAIPYLLGLAHVVFPIWIHILFIAGVAALVWGLVRVVERTLRALSLAPAQCAIVICMVALNPWVVRPYLGFPEMINDVGFAFGLAVLLYALVTNRMGLVVLGQVIASASRQTALLLLPMILIWLGADLSRTGASRKRRGAVAATAVGVAVLIYAGTGQVATQFATPSANAMHVLGGYVWLTTRFDLRELLRFLATIVESPIVPVGFIVILGVGTPSWKSGLVPTLLFGSLCVLAQPLLAGPAVTEGNGQRLVTLGLLPTYVAAGLALRDRGAFVGSPRAVVLGLVAALAVSSLHQAYIDQRIPIAGHHALHLTLYLSSCCVALGMALLERHRLLNYAVR
jgi:hypothetical protein